MNLQTILDCRMTRNEQYLTLLVQKIRVCAAYKPKLGHGNKGFSIEEFRVLYGSDPFYAWLGLDNSLMYAAHKAAGGMTSIYRQIGVGCEELFRQIIMDTLRLDKEAASWSYSVPTARGRMRTMSLDARIIVDDIAETAKRERVRSWLYQASEHLHINHAIWSSLQGVVFEVRQGYKSKDSKRQNADIANAATAYTQGYIPCLAVFSAQIDETISLRYQAEKWLPLTGTLQKTSPIHSLFAFSEQVLGFGLADFFEQNSSVLQQEIHAVLEALLRAEGGR